MVTTIHKYINQTPVKFDDTSLILGTIHPHNVDNFQIDFFYGNKSSIWNVLGEAFPEINLKSKESILNFLNRNNIWISDMIRECSRESEKVTKDKELRNLVLNTKQIEEGIVNSKIDKIYFTSGYGKNNSYKLFCEAFDIKIDKNLNPNREFEIPKQKFGKQVKGVVLFSPSGQANIGISKNKEYLRLKEKYSEFKKPVTQYKIDFYKEAFNGVV